MALIEVTAYRCEWCGRLFTYKIDHDNWIYPCQYNPSQRTCFSCEHSAELKRCQTEFCKTVYCPKIGEMFEYPRNSRCPLWELTEGYEPIRAKEVTT